MLNVLLTGNKFAIYRHIDTSEVLVCIYGSAIECYYDEQGNEMEMVVMKKIVFVEKAHRYNYKKNKN